MKGLLSLVCVDLALALAGCGSKVAPPAGTVADNAGSSNADASAVGASSDTAHAVGAAPSASSASAPPSASSDRKAAGEVLIGDIEAPKQFNPKPTLDGLKNKLEGCFRTALATNGSLHGRLKVRFVVEESGRVSSSEDAGNGSMKDAALIACVNDAIKTATFPKPGGTATVMFPLSFR